MTTRERATELLRRALGSGAVFRSGQLEAIERLVDHHASLLVVQRTGWGKSVVYFLSTLLLRERGAGPTLIISPLLSLMDDQRLMADRLGLKTATINSGNQPDWPRIEQALAANQVGALFISPERLANERFRNHVLPSMEQGLGMLVIDEAHCISDWGHDFRPDYRRIVSVAQRVPSTVPLLATTATANDRVVEDIKAQLGNSLEIIRGPLTRKSLHLQAIQLPDPAARLAWLAKHLPSLPGSGIIYTLTTTDAETVARWLQTNGIRAEAYHAGIGETAQKRELEHDLRGNRIKALVATVALGMGFDKPDLGFVIHYQRPGSVIAYYQQVGRAGRAIDSAYAILLDGREDDDIQDWFIRTAFPTPREQQEIVTALEDAPEGELTTGELQARVNISKMRIVNGLKYLEVDGVVAKDGSRWSRTILPWQPDDKRAEAITALRRSEQQRMREFVTHRGCLMQFVARELDDPSALLCGVCANCQHKPIVAIDVNPELVVRAAAFLRTVDVPIKPRQQLPAG